MTLALGDARRRLDGLREVEQDARVTRELHDATIRHAFAAAMSLEAARSIARGGVRDRISSAVERLEQMIREVNCTILDIDHPEGVGDLEPESRRLAR